jgi:hypothetical protein
MLKAMKLTLIALFPLQLANSQQKGTLCFCSREGKFSLTCTCSYEFSHHPRLPNSAMQDTHNATHNNPLEADDVLMRTDPIFAPQKVRDG